MDVFEFVTHKNKKQNAGTIRMITNGVNSDSTIQRILIRERNEIIRVISVDNLRSFFHLIYL